MPSSQSVGVTHNATFTTMVTGVGSNNFTYQWRQSGTIISGETRDTLIITNLVQNDAGIYDCTIMNQYGDSSSSSTSLTVTGMYVCVHEWLRYLVGTRHMNKILFKIFFTFYDIYNYS